MSARIPAVKAANHRYLAGIRRPHAEDDAFLPVARNQMSAHGFVQAIVAALVEQVEVLVGEQRHAAWRGVDRSIRHF